jgi:hypothetical protein
MDATFTTTNHLRTLVRFVFQFDQKIAAMDQYALPARRLADKTLLIPDHPRVSLDPARPELQPVDVTIQEDIKELSKIECYPGNLLATEVQAEIAERLKLVLHCPTQGALSCAVDAVVVVARYLGIARNALDATARRDTLPTPSSSMLRLLDPSWTRMPTSQLNRRRDDLQREVIRYLDTLDERTSDGLLNPRDIWRHHMRGIPSTTFTLVTRQICLDCLDTPVFPFYKAHSIIELSDDLICSAACTRILSHPPASAIVQRLVQLRLSTGVKVKKCCPYGRRCMTQEEDVYVADRLPSILAVGIESGIGEREPAQYPTDLKIDYKLLEAATSPTLCHASYKLAALIHITGQETAAHITASICTGGTSWVYYDGNADPPVRRLQAGETRFPAASKVVMGIYKEN